MKKKDYKMKKIEKIGLKKKSYYSLKNLEINMVYDMNFNEYQDAAKSTDIYPVDHALVCHALGLTNEAGEVAGKIKKIYRDENGIIYKHREREIAQELGDVLWYLAMVANDIEYTLEEIATMNIQKLSDRKERDKIGGSGDHR